jgi:hypothetical protein
MDNPDRKLAVPWPCKNLRVGTLLEGQNYFSFTSFFRQVKRVVFCNIFGS